jgi:hypothetical protein
MNRRARRAAERRVRKATDNAVRAAQEKIQAAVGDRARRNDMFNLAQQALALASQMPVVPLAEDHDPADGDPNAVRLHYIEEATERLNDAREQLVASTLDLYDVLASVDDPEPDVVLAPASALRALERT